MTTPDISCTAVAVQNSSEWPCSMCPIPQLRLVGVRTSYVFFLIFPGHLEFWTPLQIPIWGPPLGCTLLHPDWESTSDPMVHRLFIYPLSHTSQGRESNLTGEK